MHHFMLLHEKQFIIFTSVRKHFSPSLWEDCWLRSSRNDKTSQLGGGAFFNLDTKWNISLPSSRHSRILLHNSTRYATYRCFRFNVRQTFLESCDKKWEKRKQLNTSESLLRFDLRTSCIRSFVSRELCPYADDTMNFLSRMKCQGLNLVELLWRSQGVETLMNAIVVQLKSCSNEKYISQTTVR